ncbi:MAG: hypothetical protein AAF441_06510 [Pseudomonadota bacterium]
MKTTETVRGGDVTTGSIPEVVSSVPSSENVAEVERPEEQPRPPSGSIPQASPKDVFAQAVALHRETHKAPEADETGQAERVKLALLLASRQQILSGAINDDQPFRAVTTRRSEPLAPPSLVAQGRSLLAEPERGGLTLRFAASETSLSQPQRQAVLRELAGDGGSRRVRLIAGPAGRDAVDALRNVVGRVQSVRALLPASVQVEQSFDRSAPENSVRLLIVNAAGHSGVAAP